MGTTASNFDFLRARAPLLAQACAAAEACWHSEPAASVGKVGFFAERLARDIADAVALTAEHASQFDRLAALGAAGYLPRSIADSFHTIRQARNRAVHDGAATESQAERMLREAFHIACWYRKSFAPDLPEPPEEFRLVENKTPDIEAIRLQLEALQKALSEEPREREQELSAIDVAMELERLLAPHRERYEVSLRQIRAEIAQFRSSQRAVTPPPEGTGQADQAVSAPAPAPAHGPIQSCDQPGCRSRMELIAATRASARHGIAKGDSIWRCSRFPDCKGWRRADVAESVAPPRSPTPAATVTPRAIRRSWTEYGERDGWDVSYLTCGGRLRSLRFFRRLPTGYARALSQVAVFISRSDVPGDVPDSARTTAWLMRRLLSRGALPPGDPALEVSILRSAGFEGGIRPSRHPGDLACAVDNAAAPSDATVQNAIRWRDPFIPELQARAPDGSPLIHDDAELPFFRDIVTAACGSAGHWWHPQASLDTLLQRPGGAARRVDFLVASPDGSAAVEIDGVQHRDASAADAEREVELRKVGIPTLRFEASALQAASPAVAAELARLAATPLPPADKDRLIVWGAAVAHRVALGIAEALEAGWLRGDVWRLDIEEPLGIAAEAVASAMCTLSALAAVHGWQLEPTVHLRADGTVSTLRPMGGGVYERGAASPLAETDDVVRIRVEPFSGPWHSLGAPHGREIVIRSTCLPLDLVDNRPFGGNRQTAAGDVPRWALLRALQAVFAKKDFQPDGPHPRAQEQAIRRILAGKDVAVLLPTGAGKSLIYQLAGILMPGLTLVVDPIVSLIQDQIDGLAAHGIDRIAGITSEDTRTGSAGDKLTAVRTGDAMFLFIAPERLQQQKFRDAVREMSVANPVNMLVVDEAHCVSEWGHDFRTAYLDIGRVLRHVTADDQGVAPPLVALTGTASRAVLKDMLIELSVDRADPEVVITPSDFDRPELRFAVVAAESEEALPRLAGAIQSLPSRFSIERPGSWQKLLKPRGEDSACGIVFCQTVGGDYGARRVSEALKDVLNCEVPIYSGKPPKGVSPLTWPAAKQRAAERFKANEVTLLAATKSYGMGIDKPNVRFVIHLGIPGSIESYYQEAGRAGRDRRESVCLILHHAKARETLEYFHNKTFVGEAAELLALEQLLQALGTVGTPRNASVPFGRHAERRERAIHRLKLLGLVRDYTVDWGGKKFELRLRQLTPPEVDAALSAFVRRNQPGRVAEFERRMLDERSPGLRDRIVSRAAMMIAYVYETIVAARTRAVEEMSRLAAEARGDAEIRDRILRYLSLSKVAIEAEELLGHEPFVFSPWMALLDTIDSVDDAREWRGATARLLESDPDNPGLLLARGVAEAAASGDVGLFVTSLEAALSSAATGYSVGPEDLVSLLEWLGPWLTRRQGTWRERVYGAVERAVPAVDRLLLESWEEYALTASGVAPGELAAVLARRLRRWPARLHQVVDQQEESLS